MAILTPSPWSPGEIIDLTGSQCTNEKSRFPRPPRDEHCGCILYFSVDDASNSRYSLNLTNT